MTGRRPAPQFRQRKARAEAHGTRSRRWIPIAITAGVAALVIAGAVIGIVVANSGDGDGGATEAGGLEKIIEGPASRYVVQLGEVDGRWDILPPETYPLTAVGFVTNGYFAVRQEGEDTAAQWGYKDGYQSGFEPRGKQADVIQGGYYFRTESYLFETIEGAREAYAYLEEHHRSLPGSEAVQAPIVGNEASAFRIVRGTVGTSDVAGVYYRVVFRRGNYISVVQTNGAEPLLKVERAAEIAVRMDEKALGQRDAPTPTPASSTTPELVSPSETPGP